MGLLSAIANLFGGGLIKQVAGVVDEFVTTDKERLEMQLKFKQLDLEETKVYAELLEKVHETNIEEAKSQRLFVAGWRPFIGWIGGVSLGYTFILQPIIEWFVKLMGYNIAPPHLDTGMLFNIVLSMLGLGGLRTYEKIKGVHNKH